MKVINLHEKANIAIAFIDLDNEEMSLDRNVMHVNKNMFSKRDLSIDRYLFDIHKRSIVIYEMELAHGED